MKRTKEEAEKTKKKILIVSEKLFIENGYADTSLNTIAEKAGLTKGAIYWHYRDKGAIIDEIINVYDESAFQESPEIITSELSPLTKIKMFSYANVPDYKSKRKLRNFFRLRYEIYLRYKEKGGQAYALYFVDELAKLFKDAKQKGEIKKEVVEYTAALTISVLITGTYMKYVADETFFDNVKHVRDMMDMYFDLMSTAKGRKTNSKYYHAYYDEECSIENFLKQKESKHKRD